MDTQNSEACPFPVRVGCGNVPDTCQTRFDCVRHESTRLTRWTQSNEHWTRLGHAELGIGFIWVLGLLGRVDPNRINPNLSKSIPISLFDPARRRSFIGGSGGLISPNHQMLISPKSIPISLTLRSSEKNPLTVVVVV